MSISLTRDAALLIVIDPRILQLECLAQALREGEVEFQVQAFAGLRDWNTTAGGREPAAILFGIGGKSGDAPDVVADLQALARDFAHVPVIVIGEIEEPSHIVAVLALGARGYIPASVDLDIVTSAVQLARAGGVFVPASSVIRSYQQGQVFESVAVDGVANVLTKRQAAVADAIRQGKPNKIIAYELNLSESTVKVHVRDIMKKLKASNRTEIAYKLSS
jgi:DNA-binding NarL/FixJ family response regulator